MEKAQVSDLGLFAVRYLGIRRLSQEQRGSGRSVWSADDFDA
ncbi:hypothetical protein [Streptomyces sp. NPDC047024]